MHTGLYDEPGMQTCNAAEQQSVIQECMKQDVDRPLEKVTTAIP